MFKLIHDDSEICEFCGEPAGCEPDTMPASPVEGVFVKVIVSVIFGILAFGLICAFIALAVIRPENFTAIVEKVDVTWVLEEAGLDDVIIQEINDSPYIDEQISVNDIEEFLKREAVSREIGKMASKYAKAIAEGDLYFYVKPQDIESFLKAIEPDIREHFNYSLTDEDYNDIIGVLEEYVDLQEYQVGKLLEETDAGVVFPSALISVYPLIITGILYVLIVFDIFLLHRKKIRSAFITNGIPAILAGLLCITTGALFGPFQGLLGNTAFYNVTRYTGGIAELLMLYGLICFVAGALALIVFFIIAGARKEHMKKVHQVGWRFVWRMTGLVTNAVLLIACAIISLLYYTSVKSV